MKESIGTFTKNKPLRPPLLRAGGSKNKGINRDIRKKTALMTFISPMLSEIQWGTDSAVKPYGNLFLWPLKAIPLESPGS